MNISIISVFPELYNQFLNTSLIKRAQEKKIININVDGYFSFVAPKERIDAPSFGPGSGMLIKPEVVEKAIASKEATFGPAFKIFFSPQGQKVDQRMLEKLTVTVQEKNHLMLLPARYEGMDSRVEKHYADMVLSVGDFVVMAGDVPAMLLLEGMLRLMPDIVGKKESIERESFVGPFVDYPEYTQPVEWKGMKVPDIVRSGNHAEIEQWRQQKAAEKTVMQHFDWLRSHSMTEQQKNLARRYIPPHYAALLHTDVMLPNDQVGTTSVTSIDIHDGARSTRTYDLENFFIVTPLQDQQKIVNTLLDFWKEGPGKEYNLSRYEAIQIVQLVSTFEEVLDQIEKKEGKKPIVIATSAKSGPDQKLLSYYDQALVWQEKRPVLIIFGTGKGLSPSILKQCDHILMPIEGFSDFNHLSVRSAIATVLDRWLGINIKE